MKNHIMTAAESARFALAKKTMLVARSANECIAAATALPPLKKLFDNFWFEEELALLVGGTGTGKSLLGLQIANAISKGEPIHGFRMEAEKQKVLYLDTELNDRQFLSRYAGEGDENTYRFDDNLIRMVIDPEFVDPLFTGAALFTALERLIEEQEIKVIIVDSFAGIRNMRNNYPGAEVDLLKFFLQLKAKYNLSILITVPTHQNTGTRIRHLSGKLKDFTSIADSVFAIGQSNNDPDARYLKQLKSRSARVTYHEYNVALCKINKAKNHFTGFELLGYEEERDCLKRGMDALEKAIIAMKEDSMGLSAGEIARKLGTYKMKAWRTLQKAGLLTAMDYEEEGFEVVWEEESPWSEDGSPSEGLEQNVTTVVHAQIPAFAWNDQPHGDVDGTLSKDSGESRWSEVSSSSESVEQHVTTVISPQIPAFAWNDQPHGEVDGPLSMVARMFRLRST